MNILVAAGSPDSIKLIEKLREKRYNVTVLNMHRQMFDALMKTRGVRIVTGVSSPKDLSGLIKNLDVGIVIDESNPFSTLISPALMDSAKRCGIAYCRYEGKIFDVKSEKIIFARDNAHCVELLNKREGRVLLTISSSILNEYVAVTDYRSRLFVKISASVESIGRCETLKIPEDNICAVNGSISKDFIVALIAHSGAGVIVSEDGGAGGRIERKIEAAEESGIPIILINKPKIEYINKFRETDEIMKFIESIEGSESNEGGV